MVIEAGMVCPGRAGIVVTALGLGFMPWLSVPTNQRVFMKGKWGWFTKETTTKNEVFSFTPGLEIPVQHQPV